MERQPGYLSEKVVLGGSMTIRDGFDIRELSLEERFDAFLSGKSVDDSRICKELGGEHRSSSCHWVGF